MSVYSSCAPLLKLVLKLVTENDGGNDSRKAVLICFEIGKALSNDVVIVVIKSPAQGVRKDTCRKVFENGVLISHKILFKLNWPIDGFPRSQFPNSILHFAPAANFIVILEWKAKRVNFSMATFTCQISTMLFEYLLE